MTDERWIGPKTRESADCRRWSPITKSSPGGTTHVVCGPCARVGWSWSTYGSLRAIPSTKTLSFLISTVSPATPITRDERVLVAPRRWREEDDDVAPAVTAE